jgi:hypothetical protein
MACPICFEEKSLVRLTCNHSFCDECLREWNVSCALCRKPIQRARTFYEKLYIRFCFFILVMNLALLILTRVKGYQVTATMALIGIVIEHFGLL